MIGVPNMEPKTPPLLIVKVPPSMSSTARRPSLAYIIKTIIGIQSDPSPTCHMPEHTRMSFCSIEPAARRRSGGDNTRVN